MILRAWRYAYIQARTKAWRSQLLSAEDWYFLRRARDVAEVYRYLRGTSYSSWLPAGPTPDFPREFLANLYQALLDRYGKLLKFSPVAVVPLWHALLRRFEAENLKVLLRSIWRRQPASVTDDVLYPLGPFNTLPTTLAAAATIPDAVAELAGTFYEPCLQAALPQFQAQGWLFPLEIAIDLAVLEELGRACRRGSGWRQASQLLGTLIDSLNLSWLCRGRQVYGLAPEEAINYSIKGGRHLDLTAISALARAAAWPEMLTLLPPPYRRLLAASNTWPEGLMVLWRWFAAELWRVGRSDPFQPGLPLAYLLQWEMEIQSLAGLLTAKAWGLREELLATRLSPPRPVADYV